MLTVTEAAPFIFSRTLSATLDPWPCRRVWESRTIASAASSVTATSTTTEVEGASTAAPVKGTAATTSERVRGNLTASEETCSQRSTGHSLVLPRRGSLTLLRTIHPVSRPCFRDRGADRWLLRTWGSNPAAFSVSRAARRSGSMMVGSVDWSPRGRAASPLPWCCRGRTPPAVVAVMIMRSWP
jgi:hypothetical protein